MNKREWMLQAALMWIRAGHGGTADVVSTALSGTYDAIVAASPDTDWIEHRGEKPYPEGPVTVKLRDGTIFERVESEALVWSHGDGVDEDSEIIAWK